MRRLFTADAWCQYFAAAARVLVTLRAAVIVSLRVVRDLVAQVR